MNKLKCTRCGFTCTSEIEMRRHIEYRHGDPVSSSPSYSNKSDTSFVFIDTSSSYSSSSDSYSGGGGDFGGGGSSSSWDSGSSDSGSSSCGGD